MSSLLIRTVEKVNQIRALWGLDPVPELVPGEVAAACNCPVANAVKLGAGASLHVTVSGGAVTVMDNERESSYELPSQFMQDKPFTTYATFPDLFDQGEWPELNVDYPTEVL
jgi:hypothetical protein